MNEIFDPHTVIMNSLEIAELVQARHDNVRRTIERLAEKEIFELPPTEEIQTATKPAKVFVFVGEQGKRNSIIVAAQLCPEFTARLVDRWQELELRSTQPVIPQTLPEALRRAANLAERNQQLLAKYRKFAMLGGAN